MGSGTQPGAIQIVRRCGPDATERPRAERARVCSETDLDLGSANDSGLQHGHGKCNVGKHDDA